VKNMLFDERVLHYEMACERIGTLISIRAAEIAREMQRPHPDIALVARAQADQDALYKARAGLHPRDEQAVREALAQSRATYDLNSNAELALVGQYLKHINLNALVDSAFPVRSGIAHSDILRS
jgi:hypothetical protein